jgi:hypothetical protein
MDREPLPGPWARYLPDDQWALIQTCRQHRTSVGQADGVPFVAPHRLPLRRPALCTRECPIKERACREGLTGDGWIHKE